MYLTKTAILRAALSLAVTLTLGIAQAQQAPDEAKKEHKPKFKDNELIIQFKATATEAEIADALQQGEAEVKKQVQTPAMKAHGQKGLAHALTRMPVEQAIRKLEKHPGIAFVEPNYIYTHQATPTDPYYTGGSLWGMCGDRTSPANAYGSQASEAWAYGYTGSKAVYVGIIDEGVQYTHPDLAANMWTNPYDPMDGIDNDGNGYKDDRYGWDFASENNTVYDSTADDHGTHVAGTIAAAGNGSGVVGINWNVTVIPTKFLGSGGGTTLDAIQAIDYFVDLKRRHGLNIVALNNSWGGGGYSQSLHDAIIRAAKANILFIAAAGNGNSSGVGMNNDTTPSYPSNYDTSRSTSTTTSAGYDAVIAVAAIDRYGNKASFSNYGAQQVDLAAPGVSIYSTLPGNSYGAYNGTSMATPHVTGAAALYASTHAGATAQQIKSALLGAVMATPSMSGITTTGGRLNLSTIIAPGSTSSATVPAAPTNLTATQASSTQVTLRWTDNSSVETGYKIEYAVNGGSFAQLGTMGANSTSVSITGVSRGATYSFRVRAYNSYGNSGYSNTATVRIN